MLDAGYVDVAEYASNGWLTGLKYEDEIIQDLEKRTKSEEGKLKEVPALPHQQTPKKSNVDALRDESTFDKREPFSSRGFLLHGTMSISEPKCGMILLSEPKWGLVAW